MGMVVTLWRGSQTPGGLEGNDEEECSAALPPPLPAKTKQRSQWWCMADYRMELDDRIYGELAQILGFEGSAQL